MKKYFIIPVFIFLAAFNNFLFTQNCDFLQAGVHYRSSQIDPVSGKCIINLDLYYDLQTNTASKYVIMHIWPKATYPSFPYNHHPDSTDLAGATTIVIHHFKGHNLSHIDSVYNGDPRVLPQHEGMELTIGPSTINADYERFFITNLNLEVAAGCEIPQAFTADVWATQSESMNNVQCFITGKDFYANNPRVTGILYCNWPRNYSVQITSIDPVPMTVGYDVYLDNGDFIFNKTQDVIILKSATGIVVSAGSVYNSGIMDYLPYSVTYPESEQILWVEVSGAGLPNTVITSIENNCSALPVKLKSFSAKKSGEVVLLQWVTATENDNKGFFIERKAGNLEWQTIGFVNSLAKAGISQYELAYSFVDQEILKAIVQYRLRQTDLNGKFEYSPVRIIKNQGAETIVIFPNPSAGDMNILFTDLKITYDITLYSADGKLIKQWENCNSSLVLQKRPAGLYLLRIENTLNKEIITQKLIFR